MKTSYIYTSMILWACLFSSHIHAALDDWLDSWELECGYTSKLEQCIIANKNGNTRGITDFVCIQSQSNEDVLDQIILDSTFGEIDDEIESFLDALSKDKEASAHDTNRIIDDITKNLGIEWVYYKKYKELCNWWILAERATCWKIGNNIAGARISDRSFQSSCLGLVENKMDIYSQAAYDTVKVNKWDVLRDQYKQDIVQVQRDRYSALISPLMTDIVGHMGRLARWVTHWTPHPLQSSVFKVLFEKISNLV